MRYGIFKKQIIIHTFKDKYERMRNFQTTQSKQPELPEQFFNQSFYVQKMQSSNQQVEDSTYLSYEYVKKYFEATKINQLINKAVRTTLQSSYLPENPYNMIGRLLLHDCIFQNIRAYYLMAGDKVKKDQLEGPKLEGNRLMVDAKLGNNVYTLGYKLVNLVRQDRINTLWPQIFQQKTTKGQKKKSKKSKITNISYCLGGSSILKTGSPYSAEQSVSPAALITMTPSQTMQHLMQFAEYVIDDCIRICQSPNNIFIKLYIYTYGAVTTEWSAQNLIHNRTKIAKQIYKVCVSSNEEIKTEYLMKSSPEVLKTMGTSYIRVSRSYILIQEEGKQTKVHSLRPVTVLLTSVFQSQTTFYEAVLRSFPNKGTPQETIHAMHAQLHAAIIYGLQTQQVSWVGWSLYYLCLYESGQGRGKQKQLKSSIAYMIDSPLGFIDTLRHQISITKQLSSRSSSTTLQQQLIQQLQRSQKRIKSYIQKEQHIYPQTVLFFQAVNRNLQLILQQQQQNKNTIKNRNRNKNIKSILERIQLLFKYLLNSFYQICFVLKGYLLNQIVKVDNVYGKDGSGEIISSTVTYDIFLRKYKDLPDRVLKVNQEVSNYRQQFLRSDDQIRQLILAKYVQKYKLYQQIYGFYWDIICGKKLAYPMGKFVGMLRNQAIRFDSNRYSYKKQKDKKLDIEQTKTDGIMIYQKSADARGQHLFYSLSSQPLHDQNMHTFKTIKQIFQQYFQNDIISQKSISSLSHLQKNSYIVSISTQISHLTTQQSDFNKCKIYVDSIYHVPIESNDVYRVMYEDIVEKLCGLDENGFGVIGLYNGDKMFLDQDQVYAWTQCQQKYDLHFLRYQAKKTMNRESVAKLLKTCKSTNSQILIRGVFWVNGLLKSCEISLNFLINKEWLINLSHTYKYRIFSKHEQIARWCNYNGLKQYISSQKKISDKAESKRESIKQLYLSNHIDLIQFIAEDMEHPLEMQKVRGYSPFYSQLEHVLGLLQSIFFMLQYVKTDRSGKFQMRQLKDTIQILEYYLFDKCLRKDRYIYSEGLSVSIINMVSRINRYLAQHGDNNGEEKQLIYLQKVIVKLMNCIHYVLTSCAFGIIQAIQNQYIQEDSDDD